MERETLDNILAYIDTHICEKISLCDLSQMAGYSPFYFSKLFSEVMGMPVTGYIRIRKLQYAVVSLLEGHKVLDVAFMYSFDSHEGFTRAFTHLFGSTPSTVKKHLTTYSVPAYVVPTIQNGRIYMKNENLIDLQLDMHQLAFTFLEQSLEEVGNGYCTKIEITLLPEGKIKIKDNGRGIPLSKDLCASKSVLDKILSGRPITSIEYSQMGDLCNANLQTINSLCESLIITVNRDGHQFVQDYIRGVAQHAIYISNSSNHSGTEVIFKPDNNVFPDLPFSEKILQKWIDDTSHQLSLCSFSYDFKLYK